MPMHMYMYLFGIQSIDMISWKWFSPSQLLHRLEAVSVIRWIDQFYIFGHFLQLKFAHYHNIVAKVDSKVCRTLNKLSKIAKVAKSRHSWSHCLEDARVILGSFCLLLLQYLFHF